jgi:hypothetical protein
MHESPPPTLGVQELSEQPLGVLHATIPDKWCSVEVDSKGEREKSAQVDVMCTLAYTGVKREDRFVAMFAVVQNEVKKVKKVSGEVQILLSYVFAG